MKANRQNPFVYTAIAAALLLAFGSAHAQSDEITQLITPVSSVDVGVSYVDKDNQRFGEYNGLTDKGAYGNIDFDLVKRDNATGTWFKLQGHNLGYDDRELRLEQSRQGNWGYSVDYSRIPRYEPMTVNTGLQGLGTTTQTTAAVTKGAGTDYQLNTVRDRWTLGFDKALAGQWDVQVRYRNEVKDGNRLFGQGTFGNVRFLTDVIDQTTQQVDAMAHYNTERFQFTAGYYGTFFENNNNKITTPAAGAPFPEVALPPSNQSHQFYAEGGYNFDRAMRGTFKVALGRITQDDTFPTTPSVPVTNLDGLIDTTLLQAGLSGRATPKLSWRADLRYEKRDDKTPVLVYFPSQAVPSTTGTNDGTNEPRDIETTTGKLVGHYSLPMGLRLTGDVTFEQKKRNNPPVMSVDFRETTDETTYRVELRRAVSETVTGAVALLHANRTGSDWLPMLANNGVTPTSALIAPLHLADRKRDTVRLTVNWMVSDPLSLNFRADESRDDYTGRDLNAFDLGPRKGRGSNYSLDAAYVFNERVTATAWYSSDENRFEDATCQPNAADVCTANLFSADLRNISDTYGLGLRAKVSSKIDIGADLVDSKVRDEMNTAALAAIPATVPSLSDIHTKVTSFKLYGKYALDRKSGVRVDYIYDRYQTDDWTWANWVYSDGTTVLQNPDQKVNFVGVSYYYRF
jgi:MtrB/PioB family decaheme-associated outer membrane protein